MKCRLWNFLVDRIKISKLNPMVLLAAPDDLYSSGIRKLANDTGLICLVINAVVQSTLLWFLFLPKFWGVVALIVGVTHFMLSWVFTKPLPDEYFGKVYD